jgi:hypothetical protein
MDKGQTTADLISTIPQKRGQGAPLRRRSLTTLMGPLGPAQLHDD